MTIVTIHDIMIGSIKHKGLKRLCQTEAESAHMTMKNPPHPGKHVRVTCLEPAKLTVTAAAKALGVSRQALNNLVNGKAALSAEMAVRLEKLGWGTADGWLRLQMNYDLSQVRRYADQLKVYPPSTRQVS